MTTQIPSYRNQAEQFEKCKVTAGITEEGAAFGMAKSGLKIFFSAKDYATFIETYMRNSDAKEKAMKKFAEWQKKGTKEKGDIDEEAFAKALQSFEAAFLASNENEAVRAARVAKKLFKTATLLSLQTNSVQDLQAQLAGLSEKTIQKVSYWADKR